MAREKLILVALFVLAFVLRVVALSTYPSGFNADEANQGYSAYSILKTGKDEWGDLFPITPRSYGDYRAPLYTYLIIPSVFVFGLSEFAVRLPNVLIGTFSVLVVYFLAREILKEHSGAGKIALISAGLLAISPWHISLSRGAFEPNLPALLVPLGVFFFLRGLVKKKMMFYSGIVFGLSLFAYYSSRMLIPLILVFLYFFFVRSKYYTMLGFLKNYKVALLAVFLFGALALYSMFSGGATRALDVAIFSSSDSWNAVADKRYDAVLLGLPDSIARVFSNKIVFLSEEFTRRYLGYFSSQFLFTEGAGEATYGMLPGVGLLYTLELLFVATSLVYIFKKKLFGSSGFAFIICMILIAPIPAAITTSHGFAANRAAAMIPWIQILSAFGIFILITQLKIKYLITLISIYFVFSLGFFLEDYLFHAPKENSRQMSYGWKEAISYIKPRYDTYDSIIISRSFSEPQMFVAFYLKLDPTMVQIESQEWLRYETEGLKFVDQLGEYDLGKFTFKSIDKSYDLNRKNSLIMGKPKDFPENIKPVYIVSYPDGEDAVYFISTQQEYAQKY